MFGYVAANPDKLNSEQKERYRALYCGLCTAMGAAGKSVYKSVLSYDLVFAVMLISSYLDIDYESSERICAVHPRKKHKELINEVSAYCADMNLLLAYYKCIDDINDEQKPSASVTKKLLQPAAYEIQNKYPAKCEAIKQSLQKIADAEKANVLNPDIPAAYFGEIMAQVFLYDNSEKCKALHPFGMALGRAVYVLDAAVDLKSDIKHCRYNPLISFSSQSTNDILNMLFACVCEEYNKLGIKTDNDLLENILLSGVWTKYPETNTKEKKDDN